MCVCKIFFVPKAAAAAAVVVVVVVVDGAVLDNYFREILKHRKVFQRAYAT